MNNRRPVDAQSVGGHQQTELRYKQAIHVCQKWDFPDDTSTDLPCK